MKEHILENESELRNIITGVLEEEIKWCKEHKRKFNSPEEVDELDNFETGFLAGLKQAIVIIKKLKQIQKP